MKVYRTAIALMTFSLFIALIGGCATTRFEGNEQAELLNELNALLANRDPMTMGISGSTISIQTTSEMVELGKKLFHDPVLSQAGGRGFGGTVDPLVGRSQSWSCATCHFVTAGFGDHISQSGADGHAGDSFARALIPGFNEQDSDAPPVRAPSTLNVEFQSVLFWNGAGGMDNITQKAITNTNLPQSMFNEVNMKGPEAVAAAALGGHRLGTRTDGADTGIVVDTPNEYNFLNQFPEYVTLFDAAFGAGSNQNITRRMVSEAIGAYIRAKLPNQSPFQRLLSGERRAMSASQLRGAILFFGDKARCYQCHSGPGLNRPHRFRGDIDGLFAAIGLKDMDEVLGTEFRKGPVNPELRHGRGEFTQNPADNFKFKIPQLYNLADIGAMGHGSNFPGGGTVQHVRDMIVYHLGGIPQKQITNLHPEFVLQQSRIYTVQEIDDLADFVINALYDPNLVRFEPQSVPSGLPIINN